MFMVEGKLTMNMEKRTFASSIYFKPSLKMVKLLDLTNVTEIEVEIVKITK